MSTALNGPGVVLALSDEAFVRHFLREKHVEGVHVPPCTAAMLDNARRVLRNEIELIGETYHLSPGFSWRTNPSRDKEWQIAHHKHYWAVDLLHAWRATGLAEYLTKWLDLTTSWLDEMGTGFITASDAQVEAKRVEHWVYAYVLLRGAAVDVPAPFMRRFLNRLAEETRYIAGHLKPTRNHRTFQLFAICLSSITLPEFDCEGELARFGVRELTANLLTDLLPDGVQVEQSTHYHQLVLETAVSFLELARANGIAVDRELEARVARALAFAMHVQWPDGHLPLLNDSDDGSQADLLRRGAALFDDGGLLWAATLGGSGEPAGPSSVAFEDSGYFTFRNGWGHDPASYAARQHVVYDCGRLGDGSHSHYDIFNFCYFAQGVPLIVDPGRYTYSSEIRDGVDWRHLFKSTAAHNTVCIDGLDQTRYVSRTKHGPDAQVRDREYLLGERSDWVRAKVVSQEYAPVHERFFLYMRREYVCVVDRVDPVDGREHDAVLRYHLADHLAASMAFSARAAEAEAICRELVLRVQAGGPAMSAIERGWVSTSYGKKRRAPVLTVGQRSRAPTFFCSVIAPYGAGVLRPRVVSKRRDGFMSTEVYGETDRGPYHDTIVTTYTPETATCDLPGVRCRARDLVVRRDAGGQVTYVVGSGVDYVEVDGVPLPVDGTGRTEWEREELS